MAYISRNPFARTELHRERIAVVNRNGNRCYSCNWCGRVQRDRYGNAGLYRYRTERDGGRKDEHSGLFCSKSCHDSYHE